MLVLYKRLNLMSIHLCGYSMEALWLWFKAKQANCPRERTGTRGEPEVRFTEMIWIRDALENDHLCLLYSGHIVVCNNKLVHNKRVSNNFIDKYYVFFNDKLSYLALTIIRYIKQWTTVMEWSSAFPEGLFLNVDIKSDGSPGPFFFSPLISSEPQVSLSGFTV